MYILQNVTKSNKTLESLQTCHKIKKNARKILQNQENVRKSIKMSQNREKF